MTPRLAASSACMSHRRRRRHSTAELGGATERTQMQPQPQARELVQPAALTAPLHRLPVAAQGVVAPPRSREVEGEAAFPHLILLPQRPHLRRRHLAHADDQGPAAAAAVMPASTPQRQRQAVRRPCQHRQLPL